VKDVTLQGEVHELPFARSLNQPRSFKLLHMMRERGGANAMGLLQYGAGRRLMAGADLLKNLVAPGLRQGAGNTGKLPVSQPGNLDSSFFPTALSRCRHCYNSTLPETSMQMPEDNASQRGSGG
jgi:hypothetical protein